MKNIKTILLSVFLFIGFLLLFPASASATTYYVSPTGNDLNPGTINQPWTTPTKAAAAAQAGDTVNFRKGTYYGTFD